MTYSKMITSILFTAAAASGRTVDPIITTEWDQSGTGRYGPTYNLLTWKEAPTGCLAVAFGQVMRHFKYPKAGIGREEYCNCSKEDEKLRKCRRYRCDKEYIVSANFRDGYKYDLMPDKLTRWTSSEEIEATATLLADVGAAANVRYGKDGSAAPLDNPNVFKQLKKAFNLGRAERRPREDYGKEEWAEMVKDSVSDGQPVILTGTSSKGGHAYIVDGINEEGMVHINVGWGGYANRWYDLDNILIAGRFNFTDGMIGYFNIGPKQRELNEECGGRYGEQCREGLYCLIDDTTDEDAEGVCSSQSKSAPRRGRGGSGARPVVLEEVIETVEGKVDDGEKQLYGPFDSLGTFTAKMTGNGKGDADLYVQVGRVPSENDYACRPYSATSNEQCDFEGPEKDIFVMVKGLSKDKKKVDYTLTVIYYQEAADE